MKEFGMIIAVFLLSFALPVSGVEQKVAKGENLADVKDIKHPLKPMLWRVKKDGIEKTSYLFGTVHVSDKRVTTLHPSAKKAFDVADCFYTEVNMSATGQFLAEMKMVRKDGNTMKKSLGEELVKEVNEELALINKAFTIDTFDTMKTWVIGLTLPILKEQLKMEKPLDLQLWQRASKAGKKLDALETMDEQLGQLDKLTEVEQIKLVKLTLVEMKRDRQRDVSQFDQLIAAYLRGDGLGIMKFFNKENMGGNKDFVEKFMKLLLDERNVRMANNIEKFMTKSNGKVHFFAVGAAHYFGKKSVVELLQKKGFVVERVK